MRWVVIGSSGYIGSALCRYLIGAGQTVVSVSRRDSAPAGCEHFQVREFTADAIAKVFTTGDKVVYTAGVSSAAVCRKKPALAGWLNGELPSKLLERADAAGVESFLYLSSVKARCAPSGVIAGEEAGFPAQDAYGASKWRAEKLLLAQGVSCRLNIIRPAAVYGGLAEHDGAPGQEAWANSERRANKVAGLIKNLGKWLPRIPATGYRSFVCLSDLVQAILLVGESGCSREVFIVAEPEFYDAVALVKAVNGVNIRGSAGLLRLILLPFRVIRRTGFGARVLEIEKSELYSASRLKTLLNWQPQSRYQNFLRGC
ncbi:NAD-dependent epimerase/dehydratase family protein [Microbulbifer aggregans]|uniref:NAD-dependent epimerase/dehydratase family protein n=1 Tax=Microbulbifer aggregans TaxID=1769779 RepID=UPI001CFD0A1B|nr:NAD-dependent epimerase/dehydratase family protein [Microbulbifer aggregans]